MRIINCNVCLKKDTCKYEKIAFKQGIECRFDSVCNEYEIKKRVKKYFYDIIKEFDIKLLFLRMFYYKYDDLSLLVDADKTEYIDFRFLSAVKNIYKVAGRPDFQLQLSNKVYNGLVIEFKRDAKAKYSSMQLETLQALNKQGRACYRMYDSFIAYALIDDYINNKDLSKYKEYEVK